MDLFKPLLSAALLIYVGAVAVYYHKIRSSEVMRAEVEFVHRTIVFALASMFVLWLCVPALLRSSSSSSRVNTSSSPKVN